MKYDAYDITRFFTRGRLKVCASSRPGQIDIVSPSFGLVEFAVDASGAYVITCQVEDAKGRTAEDSVTVTVLARK